MTKPKGLRCAIYTRVSTDAGLEQDFNSLDAQREASEAYIKSQAHEGWSLIKTAYDDGGFSGGSTDRPALQKLLEDVRSGLVDIIVVYKVDRLTRSLADFAKLVELFDAHNVSFVSVTQSFNTTTSMGRLTLNVLLSFAQFEREVTGERIRDKIAASKKKGIWMGGVVPLGYRVENRKLIVVPEEAQTVRMIFERYVALGSIDQLLTELHEKNIRTRKRVLRSGKTIGEIPFWRGPLSLLLKNRIYIGEIKHRKQSYKGEHEAIIDSALFDAVQAQLAQNLQNHRAKRARSEAILMGKLFDDAGNLMSPSSTNKKGRRFRYYISRALLEGRKNDAGSVSRVPARQIEEAVLETVRNFNSAGNPTDERNIIDMHIEQVVVRRDDLSVKRMSLEGVEFPEQEIRWSPKRIPTRQVLEPSQGVTSHHRPIRSDGRDRLLLAIANGRHWLNEIVDGSASDVNAIAKRERRSKRSIHMMISLAFLAPDLVQAALDGRLPHGIGIARLTDSPTSWRKQREQIGRLLETKSPLMIDSVEEVG